MRRALTAALCAVLALGAGAALAATSSHDYAGKVAGGGKLQLRVKRSAGVRKLARFDFQRVDLKCKHHHHTATGNLDFGARIRHGKFSFRGRNGYGGTVAVAGKLVHHARKATGTVSLEGTINVDGGGRVRHCHSGSRTWTAHRR